MSTPTKAEALVQSIVTAARAVDDALGDWVAERRSLVVRLLSTSLTALLAQMPASSGDGSVVSGVAQFRRDVEFKPGSVVKFNGKDVFVVSAEPSKRRRISSHDEDMGQGREGDVVYSQAFRYRPATKRDRVEALVASFDALQAQRATDPRAAYADWLVANDAERLEYNQPTDVHFTEVVAQRSPAGSSVSFSLGMGLDGHEYARLSTSSYDDWRDSYARSRAVVSAGDLEQRAAAARAQKEEREAAEAARLARAREQGAQMRAAREELEREQQAAREAEAAKPKPERSSRRTAMFRSHPRHKWVVAVTGGKSLDVGDRVQVSLKSGGTEWKTVAEILEETDDGWIFLPESDWGKKGGRAARGRW